MREKIVREFCRLLFVIKPTAAVSADSYDSQYPCRMMVNPEGIYRW